MVAAAAQGAQGRFDPLVCHGQNTVENVECPHRWVRALVIDQGLSTWPSTAVLNWLLIFVVSA